MGERPRSLGRGMLRMREQWEGARWGQDGRRKWDEENPLLAASLSEAPTNERAEENWLECMHDA